MKRVFILFLVISGCFTILRGQTIAENGRFSAPNYSIESALSRDSILIGDQIEWSFKAELDKGYDLLFESPAENFAAGVEIISPLAIDTLSNKKGKMKLEGRMIITSFDSGEYYLPAMIANIMTESGRVDTLLFQLPVLKVNTIPIDTATYEIKDIKAQMKYPLTFKELLPWIGGFLLFVAAIWALMRYIRLRKEQKSFFGKLVVKDPPHIVALRSLDKIMKQKLWQGGKEKQFHTAVTDTLRVYIAERFNIVTMERPSQEMLDELKLQMKDETLFYDISELFSRADLVKFAKYSPTTEENEETVPTSVRFVNSTYMEEINNVL
ncbi:MAG: hypothetical protein HUJ90_04140 [Bacteroidales bacterium]|nr:hypothetical protein [Bacteroidales bacterium]